MSVAQKTSIHVFNWEIAAVLPLASETHKQPGVAGPIVGIHKNLLIIGGGANFPDTMPWLGGKKKYYDDIFLFIKNKEGKIINIDKHYKLPFPIAYGSSCTTREGIICAGGENEKGLSNRVLLIQWNVEKGKISFKDLPALPFPVANASITVIDNLIYIAGGETDSVVSNLFMTLDLKKLSAGWKKLPDLPKPVSHAVMVAQLNGVNNSIYLIGGRKRNDTLNTAFYNDVYQFDLKTNSWSKKKSLPYNLAAGTGLALNNNSILLFGGDQGITFHKTESLIMAINKEGCLVKKEELNREKIKLQATHPGFSKKILAYNTDNDTWTALDSIPFDVPVTTTALQWEDKIIIPSGEVKAGVRTPNILSGQLSLIP